MIISWKRGQGQDLGEKKWNQDESKSMRLRLTYITVWEWALVGERGNFSFEIKKKSLDKDRCV